MGMSDTITAGVRIHLMAPDPVTGAPKLVGAARNSLRFVALPRPGDQIAAANLIAVTPASSTVLPLFLEVRAVEHFSDGLDDTSPEVWVVTEAPAPDYAESCEALVEALGSRGWALDGFSASHPFSEALSAWKAARG
jgi:hypothetical protein